MLNRNLENALFDKYINSDDTSLTLLVENIQFSLNNSYSFLNNTSSNACVAFIDISGFTSKIRGFSAENVASFLEVFYQKIFPIIKQHKGHIDKLMGDGIIVVFSEAFGDFSSNNEAFNKCFDCCVNCIEKVKNTIYECKAAIGVGELYFCNTGISQIYEELTCIGHPLTDAFRLEAVASVNQLVLMANSTQALCQRVFMNTQNTMPQWNYRLSSFSLQGLGNKQVDIYER